MKPRIFIVFMLTLLLIPLNVSAKTPPITWTPKAINQTMGLGGTSTVDITFTSNEDLGSVELWIVPELQPFITLSETSFDVQPGGTYSTTLTCTIPFGTQTGLYDGTIHVRSGPSTIPATLKLELDIHDAASKVGLLGGTVEVKDPASPIYGTKITVPQGCVTEDSVFSVSLAPTGIQPPNPHLSVSEIIEVKCNSNLNGYAFVTVPLKKAISGSINLYVLSYDNEGGKWDSLPIFDLDKPNNKVTFAVTHFSSQVVQESIPIDDYPTISNTDYRYNRDRFHPLLDNQDTGTCSGLAQYSMWYYLNDEANDLFGLSCRWDKEKAKDVSFDAWQFLYDEWSVYRVHLENREKAKDQSLHPAVLTYLLNRLNGIRDEASGELVIPPEPTVILLGRNNLLGWDWHNVVVYEFYIISDNFIRFKCYDPNLEIPSYLDFEKNNNNEWSFVPYPSLVPLLPNWEYLFPDTLYSMQIVRNEFENILDNYVADNWCEDEDEDGIYTDGDGSGTTGDNYCDGLFNNRYDTALCDDNCPNTPNPDQADTDGDKIGNVCDNCPGTPEDEEPDENGCSISQLIVDLELPADQAIIPTKQYTFKWKPLNHINESSFRYFISVKEDSEPEDIIFLEDFVGYEKEVTLFGFEPGKKYFWHVWAVDQQDHWSKARDAGDWWSFTTALEVGGHSYYGCDDQEHYIHFQAIDPEHIADSVIVTGPGIDGSLSLTYVDFALGTWGTYSWFGLGQNPPTPPIAYTFHIKSDGKVYNTDMVIESFNTECATNLSTSGDLTFTWTPVSFPDAVYLVQLSDAESGMGIWDGPDTTANFIDYDGPALSSGSRYVFDVFTRDSFGNWSVTQKEFFYGEPQPATHSEDFEDDNIGPEFSAYGGHEFITDTGGSRVLHMLSAPGGPGSNTEVGKWAGSDFLYHFGADIKVFSSVNQMAWMSLELREEDLGEYIIGISTSIYLDPVMEKFQVSVSKDGVILEEQYLGTFNLDAWHSLSITIHEDYVTFGIDGKNKNISCGLFQSPESIMESIAWVQVNATNDDGLVDYYVDNLLARVSPLSLPVPPPAPTGLAADYDEANNWNWITWTDVPEAVSYNLYWGTASGVTQCSEFAGNTKSTEFSHTGVVPGSTYYYKVTAVDANGIESALSAEEWAFVPVDVGEGLVAYYPFNGNADDASGNAYHGTVYGPTLAPDRDGNPNSAYHFNSRDYIEVHTGDSLFNNSFTISVWVNFDHFNNDYPQIMHAEKSNISFSGTGPIYQTDNRPTNLIGFYQREGSGAMGNMFSDIQLNTGEWYLVTIVRNNLNYKMYINTSISAETTSATAIPMTGTYFTIGSRSRDIVGEPWGGYEKYTINGYLDEIRIYNRALSASEIQALYNLNN